MGRCIDTEILTNNDVAYFLEMKNLFLVSDMLVNKMLMTEMAVYLLEDDIGLTWNQWVRRSKILNGFMENVYLWKYDSNIWEGAYNA